MKVIDRAKNFVILNMDGKELWYIEQLSSVEFANCENWCESTSSIIIPMYDGKVRPYFNPIVPIVSKMDNSNLEARKQKTVFQYDFYSKEG